MKKTVVLCVLLGAVGLVLAANWQQDPAQHQHVVADAYSPAAAPPLEVSVTNWPFDVNVNLRVSPQVLDDHIVLDEEVFDFDIDNPYFSPTVYVGRYSTLQIRANVLFEWPSSPDCYLGWQWEPEGEIMLQRLTLTGWSWSNGTVKLDVAGRYVAFSCSVDAPSHTGTVAGVDLYLRAEF